jgi:N-acetylglucosamine-6-phosphate deacetylase
MTISANIAGKGQAELEIREGQIASVCLVGPIAKGLPFVTPGFIDIQVNGFAGVDFSDPQLDSEQVANVLPAIWKTGVTSFCPTLITNTLDALEKTFRVLEQARRGNERFARSVPGYHLEGPYLSPDKAYGAHSPDLMRKPDWNEFVRLQEAAGGNIGVITLAPELPDAIEFIGRASEAGLVVAIGHTDATPEQIRAAIDAGARLSTHLGNGCATWMHRHQNPLWAQIASDRLHASVICDGFHLPSDLLQVIVKAKGIQRCILVTDAVHVATLPAGRYSLVGRDIDLLPSGHVVTEDRLSMAGSALSMDAAVGIFKTASDLPLEAALQAASTNPGKLLNREGLCLEIAEDQLANLVLFTPTEVGIKIESVFLHGEKVYGEDRTAL